MKKEILLFLCYFLMLSHIGFTQSVSLPTDRARIKVVSIPDYYDANGPMLKVLRTDAGTPLRAGTAWIWEKERQEEPNSYYVLMSSKGLNAVRMILFDTWEVDAYLPSAVFTPTDWNDAVYRTRQLARIERSVNYASANGMYIIINSHNQIPKYNEAYANALWTYVAPYFANRTHVIYEATNEPMSGIGKNGDLDAGRAILSPLLNALKRTFNIIRAGAPNTHIMILSPPGINDHAFGTGMGNLAASFAQLAGAVDWTKTSVAYHLYNNDRGFGDVAVNAWNLRNLHSRYPGWPSENNFPLSVSSTILGITDPWRSAQFDNDIYVNQTCEKLGIGWSMWNINGQTQFNRNWPRMWTDAAAKGWAWTKDVLSTYPVNFISFTGSKSITGNDLKWVVANEIDNKQFDVLRSTNGVSFEKIGEVISTANNGSSSSQKTYNFTDATKPPEAYYQLKQIDRDGKFKLSPIVYISTASSGISSSFVYPNPFANQLNLIVAANKKENITLNIADATGKLVCIKTSLLEKGKNNLTLNMGKQPSGLYILTAKNSEGKVVLLYRVIKK